MMTRSVLLFMTEVSIRRMPFSYTWTTERISMFSLQGVVAILEKAENQTGSSDTVFMMLALALLSCTSMIQLLMYMIYFLLR